jgi:hypothetical protein
MWWFPTTGDCRSLMTLVAVARFLHLWWYFALEICGESSLLTLRLFARKAAYLKKVFKPKKPQDCYDIEYHFLCQTILKYDNIPYNERLVVVARL